MRSIDDLMCGCRDCMRRLIVKASLTVGGLGIILHEIADALGICPF